VEDMAVDVVEAVEVVTMEAMEATTTVTMEVINRKYSSFLQNIYKNQMYSTILEKYKKAIFAIFSVPILFDANCFTPSQVFLKHCFTN